VFPSLLRPIVTGDVRRPPTAITVSQALPRHDPGVRERRGPDRAAMVSLFFPLWLLATLLFVTDIVLAARLRSRPT
jgi:hypothetical protein